MFTVNFCNFFSALNQKPICEHLKHLVVGIDGRSKKLYKFFDNNIPQDLYENICYIYLFVYVVHVQCITEYCITVSRARKAHNWPELQAKTIYKPLIEKDKIILAPLHIKLGLFKHSVKVLHRKNNINAFAYLKTIFPNLSDAKIKLGLFVGPQIKKLLNDSKFRTLLSEDEAKVWDSFSLVVTCFFEKL